MKSVISCKLFTLCAAVILLACLALTVITKWQPVSDLTSENFSNDKAPVESKPTQSPTVQLTEADETTKSKVIKSYGKLPLHFEPNDGQIESGEIKFTSRGDGYNLFLSPANAKLVLSRPSAGSDKDNILNKANLRKVGPDPNLSELKSLITGDSIKPEGNNQMREQSVIEMNLVGANTQSKGKAIEQLEGKSNYFIGNDESKWKTDVANYKKVRFEQVYSGIDIEYYGNQRELEYDFIVEPNADPKQIKLEFDGVGNIGVNEEGELVLETKTGEQIKQKKPFIYQTAESGEKTEVTGNYKVEQDKKVSFEIAEYDKSKQLVIDPIVIAYSTYFGGANSGIAVDSQGNTYVAGRTNSTDIFITKISSSGSALIYSTFVGGGRDDVSNGIAVDSDGNVYVTGLTNSQNFPLANEINTGGCRLINYPNFSSTEGLQFNFSPSVFNNVLRLAGYQLRHRGSVWLTTKQPIDGFETSFDFQMGDGNVEGFTFTIQNDPRGTAALGGSPPCNGCLGYTGIAASASVQFDAIANELRVVTDYVRFGTRITDTVFRTTDIPSLRDNSVHKVNIKSDTSGRFLNISIDNNLVAANVNIENATFSFDNAYFGFTATTGDQNPPFGKIDIIRWSFTPDCEADAFVTKINSLGNELIYSTYLGGNKLDSGNGIAVDADGNAYITGNTESFNFPSTTGAFQRELGGESFPWSPPYDGGDAFITKIKSSGSELVYSTFLGGRRTDVGRGIATDADGNAYVTGYTDSFNGFNKFPLKNPRQSELGGQRDAFVTKINSSGSELIYSTFLGGSSWDDGIDIAADSQGNAYVTGNTVSLNFPTAGNVLQSRIGGLFDAFVTKLSPSGTYVYSTYLGGSHHERGYSIKTDDEGNAYITGYTASPNFPVFNALKPLYNDGDGPLLGDMFVTKLNSSGNRFVFSTYFGGGGLDGGNFFNLQSYETNNIGYDFIALDNSGNIYLTGNTSSKDFPIINAIQPVSGGAFISKFSIPTRLISGRITSANGFPLEGVQLNSSGDTFNKTFTNSNGEYVIDLIQGNNHTFVPSFSTHRFSPPAYSFTPLTDSQSNINFTAALINDNFADAFQLTGTSSTVTGNNQDATRQTSEPAHAGGSGNRSVWYRIRSLTTGQAAFSTYGSSFDTTLAVYTGTDLNNLTLVGTDAANDDAASFDQTSRVTFPSVAGTDYWIAVDGKQAGQSGNFKLNYYTTSLTISGVVTKDRVPQPNLIVRATSTDNNTVAYTTTDSNGRYSITVPAGSYNFAVLNQNSVQQGQAVTLYNLSADQTLNIEILGFGSEFNAIGSVRLPENGSSSGLQVTAEGPNGSILPCSLQDSATRFTCVGLVPGGDYLIKITSPNYEFAPNDIPLTNVQSNYLNLKFEAAHYLSGRLVNGNNRVSGATVSITGNTPNGLLINTTTNAAGEYIARVPTGYNYTVTPSLTGLAFNPEKSDFTNLNNHQIADFSVVNNCTYSVSPTASINVPAAGIDALTLDVSTNQNCSWTSAASEPWVTVNQANRSGTGSRTVTYSILPNPATVPRTATITLAGQTVTVNQEANSVPVSVQIQTNPAGRAFIIDGTTYTSTQDFNWQSGSTYTISFPTLQNGTAGTRYVFNGWSDGNTENPRTITVPTMNTAFTANFTTQHQLTINVSPSNGGTVSANPSNADNWYNANESVQLTAANNSGFIFSNWTGTNSSNSNPLMVTMSGPVNQSANFTTVATRPAQFDFDGDRRADVSVFRPSDATWYVLQSQAGFAAATFGLATDRLAPADYDGDGRTDVAVFRENPNDAERANFYILQSSNNTFRDVQFGSTGDVPLSGDFDADGKYDLSIYRKGVNNSQSIFVYRPSSQPEINFAPPIAFGLGDDKPVVGDFDGDGKADVGVFRPSTGAWYLLQSRDGFFGIAFGTGEDKPVAADYDGDGRTDVAVFRPSNGAWYLLQSRDGFAAMQFGIGTDKLVAADYDGDSKADIAVYRPETGGWYILQSRDGFGAVAFGTVTDNPVPNAFVY